MPAYLTLTLDLYDGTGNYPVSGSATFTPSSVLTDAGVEVTGQIPVTATFRAGSLPAVSLLATDNSGPLPGGWTWGVAFSGITGAPAAFSFFLPASPVSFTATDATPAVFTVASAGPGTAFASGAGVQLSGGSLPAGFSALTTYYVVSATSSTFELAAASGGPAIASTSMGSGTVTAVSQVLSNLAPVASGSAFYPYAALAGDLGGTPASPEVISTHLASPLPLAQGGTGLTESSDSGLLAALGALQLANNLSEVASRSASRQNLGLPKTVYSLDGYGGDPSGATDSTAAWQAGLAAMPTMVLTQTRGGGGTSVTYPYGTIDLGNGTYKLGSATTTTSTASANIKTSCPATFTVASTTIFSTYGGTFTVAVAGGTATITYTSISGSTLTGCSFRNGTPGALSSGAVVTADPGNIGPLVDVLGPGSNACTVDYYGSAATLRTWNACVGTSAFFENLTALFGRIDGFTMDGTNAQPGAIGLHYGDHEGGALGPDLRVQNFTGGQQWPATLTKGSTASSGGTFAAGTYYWVVTAITPCYIGETQWSNEISATLVLDGTQAMSWTAVTNATGYNIYRGTTSNQSSGAGAGENVLVATVAAGTTTYTDTGTAGTTAYPPGANVNGSVGVLFDNSVAWTENTYGRVIVFNCDNCVVFAVTNSGAYTSFEYNDLTFKTYGFASQMGVSFLGGAFYGGGSLKIRGNFASAGSSSQLGAALVLSGQFTGTGSHGVGYSQIRNCRLDLQAETNGSGSNWPYTIYFGNVQTSQSCIQKCTGVMVFGDTWTPSNWSVTTYRNNNFSFAGVITGDTNLQAGNGAFALSTSGPVGYTASPGFMSGSTLEFQTLAADYFYQTLTVNSTILLQNCVAGGQRKVFILTQAASGGPYTVTWPTSGSPSTSTPNVVWPGGISPAMSPAANAVDVYVLETVDGANWYGSAYQADASPPTIFVPSNTMYTSTATNAQFNGMYWLEFAHGSTQTAFAMLSIPANWNTYSVSLWWVGQSGTGNVDWQLNYQQIASGGTEVSDGSSEAAVIVANPGANVNLVTALGTLTNSNPLVSLEVIRNGTSGSDTYATAAAVHGLIITKVS